jgi:hypothetical protein
MGWRTSCYKKQRGVDGFEAEVDFPVDAIESLMAETVKAVKGYASVREAILTDNPLETAYATHYQSLNNYAVQVFSTLEAATEWLYGDGE